MYTFHGTQCTMKCNQNVCKTNIKKVCNVSEVTINNCYKKLDSIQEQIIPKSILQKYT